MPLNRAAPSHRDTGANYKVIYSFKGGTGGEQPASDLLDVDGKLYGTTFSGGDASSSRLCYDGCGTAFESTTAGAVRILHSFTNYPNDGAYPDAGLIALRGELYGTATNGGANGTGAVYAMSTTGKEKLLYSFGSDGDGDGRYPASDLLALKGVLYGTTEYGGKFTCYSSATCGTVFKVTASGKERVLHTFRDDRSQVDGFWPRAGLVAIDALLYGTTPYGSGLAGTVYTITPSGKESVLYGFSGRHDGAFPFGGLTALNGEFYGTAIAAGAYGHGAIFAVNASGKERTVYEFKGSPTDGSGPLGNLTVVNGKLYGATAQGGKYKCFANGEGCGTVFAVTSSGTESVLHNFKGGDDGADPNGGVADVDGLLYGTTYSGGTGSCSPTSGNIGGCGTIFEVTP
jgi:uncharacterized repeat protein (TIGR03803 family)